MRPSVPTARATSGVPATRSWPGGHPQQRPRLPSFGSTAKCALHMTIHRVLLTGATGYVGGRLLAELERRGVALRCFLRRPESLRGRAAPSTELAAGDALDAQAVARALGGAVDVAYYLIHSMGGEDFAARDREAARIFATAAREAGV